MSLNLSFYCSSVWICAWPPCPNAFYWQAATASHTKAEEKCQFAIFFFFLFVIVKIKAASLVSSLTCVTSCCPTGSLFLSSHSLSDKSVKGCSHHHSDTVFISQTAETVKAVWASFRLSTPNVLGCFLCRRGYYPH